MIYIFFVYSILNIHSQITDFLNPFNYSYTPYNATKSNKIIYGFNIDYSLNNKNLLIKSKSNYFEGNFNFNFWGLKFNYLDKRSKFYFKKEDSYLKFDNDKKLLELGIPVKKYGITFMPLINYNTDADKPDFGVYLSYEYVKNIKYKIDFSDYNLSEYFKLYILGEGDDFIFLYNYKKNIKKITFNLELDKINLLILKLNEKINTFNKKKKGFSQSETSDSKKFMLKFKIKDKYFNFYLSYFENFLISKTLNEFDDTKYAVFKLKEFYNFVYLLGIEYRKFKLKSEFLYQKINGNFYSNIEVWPFTENSEVVWAGGRLNIFSKPDMKRYIWKFGKYLKFKNNLQINFSVFYDYIILLPNTKTYEAGIFGLGRQNEKKYTKQENYEFLHFQLGVYYEIFKDWKFKSVVKQLVPLRVSGKGSDITPSEGKKFRLQGFDFRFKIESNF